MEKGKPYQRAASAGCGASVRAGTAAVSGGASVLSEQCGGGKVLHALESKRKKEARRKK